MIPHVRERLLAVVNLNRQVRQFMSGEQQMKLTIIHYVVTKDHIMMHAILTLFFSTLVINQSSLFTPKTNSFECFDTCYATPTFITELLHLVTSVKQLF